MVIFKVANILCRQPIIWKHLKYEGKSPHSPPNFGDLCTSGILPGQVRDLEPFTETHLRETHLRAPVFLCAKRDWMTWAPRRRG